MAEPADLAAIFLAHVKVRLARPSDTRALHNVLSQAWKSARAQWTGVELSAERFVPYVAERLPDPEPSSTYESLLGQMALNDLYLACACVHQVPLAVEQFELNYLRQLSRNLKGPTRSVADIEDIVQQTSETLLVRIASSPPKLAEFKGKGALMSWVNTTALRISAKVKWGRVDFDEKVIDDILHDDGKLNPELLLLKQRHLETLRKALREGLASLSDEQRHLLLLHYKHKLSGYKIAKMLGISQPTVSRHLREVRDSLEAHILRYVREHLGLTPSDFKSFMRVLDSQLALSFSKLMENLPDPDDDDPGDDPDD